MIYSDGDFFVNDLDKGWDGIYWSQMMNSGVYIWLLIVFYEDGIEEVLCG